MKHKISTLFYAKTAKSNKNGLLPIYQRITVNGERIEMSTSKFIEKAKWNTSAGKIKGSSEEARLINSYLDILKNKVYETEKWMVNNNQEINAPLPRESFRVVFKLLKFFLLKVSPCSRANPFAWSLNY